MRPKVTPEQRFWPKVNKTDTCWLWLGACYGFGYGKFRDGKMHSAHRWAYEYLVGPVPKGLHLDHLCRVPACVNPAHLEPVTPGENTARGIGVCWMKQRAKTHCPQGHPYDDANTFTYKNHRYCKECHRTRERLRHRAAHGL